MICVIGGSGIVGLAVNGGLEMLSNMVANGYYWDVVILMARATHIGGTQMERPSRQTER